MIWDEHLSGLINYVYEGISFVYQGQNIYLSNLKSLNLFCQNGLCILLKNFVHGYFNNNCLKITCLLDSIISLWGCELILHLGIWLSCSGNNFKTDKDLFSLKSYLNYNNRIKTPQSVKSSFTHLFNVELPHFIFLGVCVAETSLCKTGNSLCLNL